MPEDDWPIYELIDATIYRKSKDGKTLVLANPLLVHLEGPVIVQGHVEVEPKQLPNREYSKFALQQHRLLTLSQWFDQM